MKQRLPLLALACAMLLATVAASAADTPLWQQAKGTYESAESQYRARQYGQAQPLFEEFVRKYPSNENVPIAYYYLANCCFQNGKPEAGEEALDQIIKQFPGDPTWYLAFATKLQRLHDAKKYDEYVDVLEDMCRQAKVIPLRMTSRPQYEAGWRWPHLHTTRRRIPHWRWDWLMESWYEDGWELDMIDAGDTPERAQKMLRALDKTFRECQDELYGSWQVLHLLLLQQAGKDRDFQKAFETYSAAWDDDPRGIQFWEMWGEHLQDANDFAGADKAFASLTEKYWGYDTLQYVMAPRFDHLFKKQRYDDFTALARKYLETYPEGFLRNQVLSSWVALLRPPAVNGDAQALADLLKVIEENYGADSAYTLRFKIDLDLDLKKPAEAVPLAKAFLDDKQWSAQTYDYLRQLAGRDEAFKPLLAEADKKYGIVPADPKGEAAKLLAELRTKMKDELVRHMEDAGAQIFSKHRNTYEALVAARELSEYYYRKVMPENRDKWMNRVIQSWPKHPETQNVLIRQVQAHQAGKQYKELGTALDLLRERFPTAAMPFNWFQYRIEAYRGVRDEAGALAMARAWWGPPARRGNVQAVQELSRYETNWTQAETTSEKLGAYWMEKARETKGTRSELYCLRQALEAYYIHPFYWRHLNWTVMPDQALAVAKQLVDQTMDGEIAWNERFRDVEIMATQSRPKESLDRLEKLVSGKQKIRDLFVRMNAWWMAQSYASDVEVAPRAVKLAKQLEKVVFTRGDKNALLTLQAEVFRRNKEQARAERIYLDIIKDSLFPVNEWSTWWQAKDCAMAVGGSARAMGVTEQYIRQISRCQSIVPRVLYEFARHLGTSDPVLRSVITRLKSQFPAATVGGQLEQETLDRIKREQEKKQ